MEQLFKNVNYYQLNDIKDIFSLSSMLKDNFLDENFKLVINIFKEMQIKAFNMSEEIKKQISNLYEKVINCKNKEQIYKEIWSFLLLGLIKAEQNEKIKKILSIFENLKGKNEIIKIIFKDFRRSIGFIPQIKNHFIDLLKYEPCELNFIIDNMHNYIDFINFIEKNINYFRDIKFEIFPTKFNNYYDNSEEILHKIIIILRECKDSAILETSIFKKLFNNYLKILDKEEKKILLSFLSINSSQNKFLINEIKLDEIKLYQKDNKEIISTIFECLKDSAEISFDFIEDCLQNIILEVLSEDYLKKLKSIINQVYNNNEDKRQLYLLLFNKLKNLKGLFNLWEIFDYSKFNKDEEKYINMHIKKFWDLFNFDKNNRDNYTYFGKMFLFLKNSKNNQNKFVLKITKIENL